MRVQAKVHSISFALSACWPAAAIVLLTACSQVSSPDANVASLSLMCTPTERAVRCRLQAVFRDVSTAPRDITAEASWHVSGVAEAYVEPDGTVETNTDGDVQITADFAGHRVGVPVRLVRDQPGEVLATIRGRVYAGPARRLR